MNRIGLQIRLQINLIRDQAFDTILYEKQSSGPFPLSRLQTQYELENIITYKIGYKIQGKVSGIQ